MTEEDKVKILRTLSDIEDVLCEPCYSDIAPWGLLDSLRKQIEEIIVGSGEDRE